MLAWLHNACPFVAVANACMAVQSCQDNFDSALAAKRKADKQGTKKKFKF